MHTSFQLLFEDVALVHEENESRILQELARADGLPKLERINLEENLVMEAR